MPDSKPGPHKLDLYYRDDQPANQRLVNTMEGLSASDRTAVMDQLQKLGDTMYDDGVGHRITIDHRYEAVARSVPMTKFHVAAVIDTSGQHPWTGHLMMITTSPIGRDTLFRDCVQYLNLSTPHRKDH